MVEVAAAFRSTGLDGRSHSGRQPPISDGLTIPSAGRILPVAHADLIGGPAGRPDQRTAACKSHLVMRRIATTIFANPSLPSAGPAKRITPDRQSFEKGPRTAARPLAKWHQTVNGLTGPNRRFPRGQRRIRLFRRRPPENGAAIRFERHKMQKTFRKWIEFRVEVKRNPNVCDTLLQSLADVFHESGLGGVVIDDPRERPLEDWGQGAVSVRVPAVTAYLPHGPGQKHRCRELQEHLDDLQSKLGIALRTVLREVDEEDWAESWKRFFKPIRICDHIVIKPSWETVDAGGSDLVIDIDPGMAFGSGDHPTTRMCIDLVRQHLVPGSAVLDVGTGSGILAIAAAGLGAASIWALDRDETALAVAAENLRRNGVDEKRCRLICGHLLQCVAGRFDLVVANILSEAILEMTADLPPRLQPEATFIASGINADNGPRVVAHLESNGFVVLQQCRSEDWVALACRRPQRRPPCG